MPPPTKMKMTFSGNAQEQQGFASGTYILQNDLKMATLTGYMNQKIERFGGKKVALIGSLEKKMALEDN